MQAYTQEMILSCRAIYTEAFGVAPIFDDVLFGSLTQYLHVEYAGQIVSMLFALPCILQQDDRETDCLYLYACATDEKHRSCGYMTKLIDRIVKENADTPLFLVPADESLLTFYEHCSFRSVTAERSDHGAVRILPKAWGDLLPGAHCVNQDKYTVMLRGTSLPGPISFAYVMDT